MADLPPDRPNDAAWSDLEHGFFAAAPPDVPELPPEPMRFDDLEDPAGPPPPPWRAALSRARLASARARRMLQAARAAAQRRSAPALARAWRRSGPALARAWQRSILVSAATLKRSALALAAVRIGARKHRLIAAGAAALLVVMGVSAGVVASRGGAGAPLAAAPLAVGSACITVGLSGTEVARDDAPPALLSMSVAEPEVAAPADSIAAQPALAPRPKRKHAKHPARQVVRVKPAKPAALR